MSDPLTTIFTPKVFHEIAADMVEHLRVSTDKITDFNAGSVARSLLEAGALELDEFYQSVYLGLLEAIPEAIYRGFGFDKLQPVAAYGELVFSLSAPVMYPVSIPAGTLAQSDSGAIYATTEAAEIAEGALEVGVMAQCTTVGTLGNVGIGAIRSTQSVHGLSVTNRRAFISGRDMETDTERQARFSQYVSTLARSTLGALHYGASQVQLTDESGAVVEYVADVHVYEPFTQDITRPVGFVRVLISGPGGYTSQALVAEVQRALDGYVSEDGKEIVGWKAAGVVVDVIPVERLGVEVIGQLTLRPGYTAEAVITQASAAITAYIDGLGIGEDVVMSQVISAAQTVDGVYAYRHVLPAADVAVSDVQVATPVSVNLSVQ